MAARYGLVHRSRVFGIRTVGLQGPDGIGLMLFDQAKLFSSAEGWEPFLGLLFPRGLMLLDFDEHRLHRRALSVAFKAGPLNPISRRSMPASPSASPCGGKGRRTSSSIPRIKQLTLDLAATSFLGEAIGPEVEAIKRAFIDTVAAATGVIRRPLPGTAMRRGVDGRAVIVDYFSRQAPLRRERGGEDIFSQLCRATHEDGSPMSVQDIADHMNFLMMAAHDTLTSSLSALVYFLCGSSGLAGAAARRDPRARAWRGRAAALRAPRRAAA